MSDLNPDSLERTEIEIPNYMAVRCLAGAIRDIAETIKDDRLAEYANTLVAISVNLEGPKEPRPPVEYYARAMALWHGQKMVAVIKGENQTVASLRGFGRWDDSSERYADKHWEEYKSCGEWIMRRFHKGEQ